MFPAKGGFKPSAAAASVFAVTESDATEAPDDESEEGRPSGPFAWYREQRRAARANATLNVTWRVMVGISGAVVVLAGVAMLALPGPGWGTIILGLAILATEFAWARRLRATTVRKVKAATAGSSRMSRRQKAFVAVGLVVFVVVLAIGYYVIFGVPGWWPW